MGKSPVVYDEATLNAANRSIDENISDYISSCETLQTEIDSLAKAIGGILGDAINSKYEEKKPEINNTKTYLQGVYETIQGETNRGKIVADNAVQEIEST